MNPKLRRHPLAQVLSGSAQSGESPTAKEIDDAIDETAAGMTTGLTDTARRSMRSALRSSGALIASLRSEGQNGAARHTAAEAAAELVDAAGDWSPPRDTSLDNASPRELAARIPRR